MPPKPNQKAPGNLQELIKNLISKAFPGLPNDVAKTIKVCVSKFEDVDYQFYIGRISANRGITNQVVADRIKEKAVDNDPNKLIRKMELSDNPNQSYVNIYTKVPSTKPCKACEHGIKLGQQAFEFRPTDPKLSERLNEEYFLQKMYNLQGQWNHLEQLQYVTTIFWKLLYFILPLFVWLKNFFLIKYFQNIFMSKPKSHRFHLRRDRKTTTITKTITENLKVHLGADQFVYDIRKAVTDIAKRDYPELDSNVIPPIFVPQFFLAKHPEALNYERYIEELKVLEASINLSEENNQRVKQLNQIIGECAEKKVYTFLKECIEDEEVLVVNNFKVMELQDLDEIAEDFEKDFFILNLTKRYMMSLEVKANCNNKNLESAWTQSENCKDLINKWVGADLSEENGWSFFSIAYFQNNPDNFSFCDNCADYIIVGEEYGNTGCGVFKPGV